MNKRIISSVIAGVISITTITSTVQVNAAPSNEELQQSREQYEALKVKVNEVTQKVQEYDDQISQLMVQVENNNNKINGINVQVDNTNKEIEQVKVNIASKQAVLGKRLREAYKSGGATDYISMILSADSFSDLIAKIDTVGRLLNMDQKVVQELDDNKSALDEKVDSLSASASEIQSLNDEIAVSQADLNQKKTEQQDLVDQAKAEEDAFEKQYLIPMEMEIAQGFINTANNKNSSIAELNDAISALTAIRKQTKSPTVIAEIDKAINTARKTISSRGSVAATRGALTSGNVSVLLNYAYKFQGCKYVWGATGPTTFDCSGFTSYVYRNSLGIEIGRTTYDQINAGVEVSRSELKPGDLVFPHSGHVGIYVGNNQMIHAPRTGDVVKIGEVYSFWRARRIIQ